MDLSGGRLPTHAWGSHGSHVSPSAAPDIMNAAIVCVLSAASCCSSERLGRGAAAARCHHEQAVRASAHFLSCIFCSPFLQTSWAGETVAPSAVLPGPQQARTPRNRYSCISLTFGGDTASPHDQPARQTTNGSAESPHSLTHLPLSRRLARPRAPLLQYMPVLKPTRTELREPAAQRPACPIHVRVSCPSEVEILLRDTPSPLGQTPYASTRQRCVSDLSPISRSSA